MAAPVDRQRLGRRGPLAAEHGTTSWPKWLPAMEQSCQGSKARSSCKIHFLIKLTHMTPSRPQWNAWAEKKASTETGAKSVSHCPIPPFSSEPGSSQDARTRTKTRHSAHANIQRRGKSFPLSEYFLSEYKSKHPNFCSLYHTFTPENYLVEFHHLITNELPTPVFCIRWE